MVDMNTRDQAIRAKVTALIVKQLGIPEIAVQPDRSFVDDLGADSLVIMELLMAMEDEFGFVIPDEVAAGIRTVGDAIAYIKSAADDAVQA